MQSCGRGRRVGSVDDFQARDQLVDCSLLVLGGAVVGAGDALDHGDILLALDADCFVLEHVCNVIQNGCRVTVHADGINGAVNQIDRRFGVKGQVGGQLPLNDRTLQNRNRPSDFRDGNEHERCSPVGRFDKSRGFALKLIEPERRNNLVKNQPSACEHQGSQCEPNQSGVPIQ